MSIAGYKRIQGNHFFNHTKQLSDLSVFFQNTKQNLFQNLSVQGEGDRVKLFFALLARCRAYPLAVYSTLFEVSAQNGYRRLIGSWYYTYFSMFASFESYLFARVFSRSTKRLRSFRQFRAQALFTSHASRLFSSGASLLQFTFRFMTPLSFAILNVFAF